MGIKKIRVKYNNFDEFIDAYIKIKLKSISWEREET